MARPKRIVSGGQSGVDRGALDAAIALGVPHGGWCPRGRRAEDGRIPDRYHLTETESPDYRVRTEKNVLDSDGTAVLCRGAPGGGTALTVRLAQRHRRPLLTIDLAARPAAEAAAALARFVADNHIEVLNVAGPRQSRCPGIDAEAKTLLLAAFASAVD